MIIPRPTGPSRRYLRHGMLPQLVAFEAVMRMGCATRAADSLYIAQPTLSGHLRKLSEALGVPLFHRQGKRLVPTDAAHVLLRTTHEVFDALERCERLLARPAGSPHQAAAQHVTAPPAPRPTPASPPGRREFH